MQEDIPLPHLFRLRRVQHNRTVFLVLEAERRIAEDDKVPHATVLEKLRPAHVRGEASVRLDHLVHVSGHFTVSENDSPIFA
jgi:hypothetical protein